jgi:large subunit ribosomal protein L32
MAVPRKRKSHTRRRNQRSHDALEKPNVAKCPNCDAPRLAHRMCPACGWYADRIVVAQAED